MHIQKMRNIDSLIGGIVCLLLEISERVKRMFFNRPSIPSDVEKILITKYLGMGSILLATPMLRGLRSRFPKSKIVFLTFDGNAQFARQIGVIDEVISIRTRTLPLFTVDLLRALSKIRRERFDLVFDLEFFARFSTIVSYLSGAKMRVGYYLPKLWRGDLLTHQVHFNPYRHVTEVFAAQLKPLGIEISDFTLMPPTVKEDKVRDVAILLEEKGVVKGDWIASVNVNASDLSTERRWPKESFVRLIASLIERKKEARIILVGSKGEAEYVKGVYDSLPEETRDRAIDLSGNLDIEEFMALLKQSSLFITNDSGPLHIASALGTPTVSFFGPESPSLYGPVGDRNTVFYADIYCSPCLNVYNAKTAMCNGDNRCMKEISVEKVKKAFIDMGLIK